MRKLTEDEREWVDEAPSMDSAYERVAMLEGLVVKPLFDENKGGIPDYLKKDGT